MPANNKPRNNKRRRPNHNQRPATRAPIAVDPPENAGDDRYAPTAWVSNLLELPLPSGQLCLVKKAVVAELTEAGLVDDFDRLTPTVQKVHVNKKGRSGGPPARMLSEVEQARMIIQDTEKFQEILRKVDQVVKMTVVQPKLYDPPEDEAERVPGRAYMDYVTDEDKGFIVQFAFGGANDLQRFRDKVGELGDGMDELENVEESAE